MERTGPSKDKIHNTEYCILQTATTNKFIVMLKSPVLDEVFGALDVNSPCQTLFGGSSAESSLAYNKQSIIN